MRRVSRSYPTQVADVHDAVGRVPSVVWPDVQLALVQDALVHEALVQDALFHEAEVQEADVHEALFQDAFALAALVQLAESNIRVPLSGSETTYVFRPRFGFGGETTAAAAWARISPTPSA